MKIHAARKIDECNTKMAVKLLETEDEHGGLKTNTKIEMAASRVDDGENRDERR
jgi:hypothetical protein